MLDAAEYLHLAIHSSQENNHHAALSYLNEALKLEPNNASARYFLAAEHAELGLLERAFNGMKEAVELDTSLDVARFQLGLLSLQLSRPDDAEDAFAYLADLSTDESLKLFASAYLFLLKEESLNASEQLKAGIAICNNNPALKADMTRVLESLSSTTVEKAAEESVDTSTVYLGAYRDHSES